MKDLFFKLLYLLFILTIEIESTYAQQEKLLCWVSLKDKPEARKQLTNDPRVFLSDKCIQNRSQLRLELLSESDLPLHTTYIEEIRKIAADIRTQSKWLNAISMNLDSTEIVALQKLSFVKDIKLIKTHTLCYYETNDNKEQDSEKVLEQIHHEAFSKDNIHGQGVRIGVIDAGFYNASTTKGLKELFQKNQIKGFKDYVNPSNTDPSTFKETSMDDHGTIVLTKIAGNTSNKRIGMATDAEFYLARTDHGDNEFRAEEDYWVNALEWMDSLGVRLVNSSLGYSDGFDIPDERYSPEQMNGSTTVVSRAASIAAKEKGMILVVSAGNEGYKPKWRIVSAPADSPDVLSVGATDINGKRMNYSSIGPEFIDFIKPDVACYSLDGTSFSAPVITGLVACILQNNPSLSYKEIFHIVRMGSSMAGSPNNYVGYGVPNAFEILNLLNAKSSTIENDKKRVPKEETSLTLKLSKKEVSGVLTNKKTPIIVVDQDIFHTKKGKITLTRSPKISQTTIQWEGHLIEVIWE